MVHVYTHIDRYMSHSPVVCVQVEKLLKKVEFVMVPVVNPDGYVVSWTRVTLPCMQKSGVCRSGHS